jgi:AraC-like DNA-binding protein
MDVLADALLAMRTGRARSARTEARAPWAFRSPEFMGTAFHVVLQGACWLLTPSSGTAPLALGPGDVVFLRRGGAHVLADHPASPLREFAPQRDDSASPIGHVRFDGPGAASVLLCRAYHLDVARPHPLLNELPDVFHLPARPAQHPELRGLIDLLYHELGDSHPGRDAIVPALVDAMLLYILRAWVEQSVRAGAPSGWAAALMDPAIGKALERVHAEPARRWTVEDLAATASLSRSVFARRFTDLIGHPPLGYLTWWRMTIAGRMLRDSTEPLASVARRVGYSSEFAFAKAFRREFGLAPGQYRRGGPASARGAISGSHNHRPVPTVRWSSRGSAAGQEPRPTRR